MIPYGKQLIEQDDIDAVVGTLQSDYLTTGPKVKAFEDALAAYCEVNYCVAVANGTAALHLASLILLSENDKVLTTPNSFLATSNAILYAGAKPIFVDIAEDGNIDLDLCEQELQKDPTIKAIYPVAFSGHMIDQKKLKHLKDTYSIIVLEDCAHAIGAKDGDVISFRVNTFASAPAPVGTPTWDLVWNSSRDNHQVYQVNLLAGDSIDIVNSFIRINTPISII